MFDTAFSRNFSLLESQREFVQRFRGQASSTQTLPVLTSACPGVSTLLDMGNRNAGVGGATQVSGRMASLVEEGALRVTQFPETVTVTSLMLAALDSDSRARDVP